MKRLYFVIFFFFSFYESQSQEPLFWFSKSDSIIADAHQKLKSIEFDRVKLIPIYDFTVDEVEASLAFLENLNFEQQEGIGKDDYEKYAAYLRDLQIATAKKRVVVNQKLANLDYEFYRKGKQYLKQKQFEKSQELFEKSVETNYFYSLSHCMIARIYAIQEEYKKAAEKIEEAYQKTYPNEISRAELFKTAVKIKDAYFRYVDTFLVDEQFNQVIKRLKPAENICRNLQIDCEEDIQKRRSAATFGIYKAYLSVAKRAINSNQPTFAEQYIAKAKNYQNENKESILHSQEADELLLSISDVYEEKGLILMDGGDFEEAIEHFNKALYFCKQNKGINCNEQLTEYISSSKKALFDQLIVKADIYLSEDNFENAEFYINKASEFQKIHSDDISSTEEIDSLLSKLNYVQYKYLIGEGKYFIKKDDFLVALENFETATNLENKYAFEKDTLLYKYKQKAVKPIIIDLLSTASLKAWAKEFNLSEEFLNKGIKLQKKYTLEKDKEINKKIEKVKHKLNKKPKAKKESAING